MTVARALIVLFVLFVVNGDTSLPGSRFRNAGIRA
jgi:hypothetical protein